MRWRSLLTAALIAVASLPTFGQAQDQRAADDSFVPVVVENSETVSITTNTDPDILPGLRPLPPEAGASDCIDLKPALAEEAKAIAPVAQTVARKGDPARTSELQIKLAGDRTIRFFDYPCGENYTSYVFLTLLPKLGFALVQKNIYEDYSYLAVSLLTGRISTMLDQPVLSPDGKRFATYRYDQLNGITELTLYAVKPDRVLVEASCEAGIADAENRVGLPKWTGPESLSFVVAETGAPFPDGPALKRDGKNWVLQGPATFTLEGKQKKPFRLVCKNFD